MYRLPLLEFRSCTWWHSFQIRIVAYTQNDDSTTRRNVWSIVWMQFIPFLQNLKTVTKDKLLLVSDKVVAGGIEDKLNSMNFVICKMINNSNLVTFYNICFFFVYSPISIKKLAKRSYMSIYCPLVMKGNRPHLLKHLHGYIKIMKKFLSHFSYMFMQRTKAFSRCFNELSILKLICLHLILLNLFLRFLYSKATRTHVIMSYILSHFRPIWC